MKFTINSKQLLSALSSAGRVVPAKAAIQILTNFLVEAADGEVKVTACDTENRATASVQAETEGEGKFCIDAKFLSDVIRALPDCPVTVSVSENYALAITTDKNAFNASAQPADAYPPDNFDEEALAQFSLPTETLLAGFSETSFAVGTDDFHPQMMGVCLDVKPGKAVFCATDTRRLVRSEFEAGTDAEVKCIIPTKAIAAVSALAAKSPSVSVKICCSAAVFSGDGFSIRAQLIKGNFPDYNRVIPASGRVNAEFQRAAALSAVRRVAACADSQYGALKFKFDLGGAVVSSSDESFGRSATESVECDYGGAPMSIGLAADLLASLLAATQADKAVFSMTDSSRPVVIKPVGDDHLTMLLMPMNVK